MSAAAQLATANVLPVQAGSRDARAQDDTSADGGAAFASLLGGDDAPAPRAGGDRVALRGAAPDRASDEDDTEPDLDSGQDTATAAGGMPLFVCSLVSLTISSGAQDASASSSAASDATALPTITASSLSPLPSMPRVSRESIGSDAAPDLDATATNVIPETPSVPLGAATEQTMLVPDAAKPEPQDGAREALSLLEARPAQGGTKPPVLRVAAENSSARGVPALDLPEQTETMSLKVVRQETHLAVSRPAAGGIDLILAANRVDTSALGAPDSDQVALGGKTELPLAQPVLADAAGGRGAMDFAGQGGADTGERGSRQETASADPASQVPTAALTMASPSTASLTKTADQAEVSDVPSPATQVADRIATAISSGEVSDTSTGGAVRVLHIELKPQNLGSVTVRVSLKDNTVTMHIEAQRHETATAIERERDVLSTALKQAGYVVDGITAQTVDRSRADSNVTPAGGSGSMSGSERQTAAGQNGGQSFQSPGQRGSGQREASPEPRGSARGVNDGQERSSRERSGALYV